MPTLIRDLIRPAAALPEADVCLAGLPLDFGAVLEGGRAGAAHAPEAIQRELRRYHKTDNLEHNVRLDGLRVADAGNPDLRHPNHATNHQTIWSELTRLLNQYPRVVVPGGSHDGTVRDLRAAPGGQSVGGTNLDAPADGKDRAVISSGTPFGRRRREEALAGERFTEIGLHSNLTTWEDIGFLHRQQARLVPLSQVQQDGLPEHMDQALRHATAAGPAFVSFDMDSCAEAYAPAVSALSADGLMPRQVTQAAFMAGKEPDVLLFELMELNPLPYRDNQTARLAATILTACLTGGVATLDA